MPDQHRSYAGDGNRNRLTSAIGDGTPGRVAGRLAEPAAQAAYAYSEIGPAGHDEVHPQLETGPTCIAAR
jgi:hypothetical protein